jgi:hypothetical protein
MAFRTFIEGKVPGAPFTDDLKATLSSPIRLLCFVKEAMGVRVDGLYAFAVPLTGMGSSPFCRF